MTTHAGYELYELAILRAAVEGLPPGTYFGSHLALDHWTKAAERAGLTKGSSVTELGMRIYARFKLGEQPKCRATFWGIE